MAWFLVWNVPHSNNIFKIQKGIIRIITKSRYRDSCGQLFKKLDILPSHSQYVFSLLPSAVKNWDFYTINQDIHGVNTRYNTNLHFSMATLTAFQKGAYFFGIKLFNHFPMDIKKLPHEIKLFKDALQRFSYTSILFNRREL